MNKKSYYLKVHGRLRKETGIAEEAIGVIRHFGAGKRYKREQVIEWAKKTIELPRYKPGTNTRWRHRPQQFYKDLILLLSTLSDEGFHQLCFKYPIYSEKIKLKDMKKWQEENGAYEN